MCWENEEKPPRKEKKIVEEQENSEIVFPPLYSIATRIIFWCRVYFTPSLHFLLNWFLSTYSYYFVFILIFCIFWLSWFHVTDVSSFVRFVVIYITFIYIKQNVLLGCMRLFGIFLNANYVNMKMSEISRRYNRITSNHLVEKNTFSLLFIFILCVCSFFHFNFPPFTRI